MMILYGTIMSKETQLINCPETGDLLDLPEGLNK